MSAAPAEILKLGDYAFQVAWTALSPAQQSAIGALGFERFRNLTPHIGESTRRAERVQVERAALPRAALVIPQGSKENDSAGVWPAPLDLAKLAGREPVLPRFIVKDMVPAGYASLFAGHGGLGKSGIALHLAVCIALGLPFFGQPAEQCRVLYLSCEDRENVLHWRLTRICAYLGIALTDLVGRLEVLDLVGHDATLWERDARTGMSLTVGYWQLVERMEQQQTQVLFADGISDVYGGHGGSKHETKRHINSLVARVPANTGAVILVGHIDKKSVRDGGKAEGFDSNAGWHNSVRARWFLYPEKHAEDDEHDTPAGSLLLDLRKSNFGPAGLQMRFQWDSAAHLFVGEVVGGATLLERKLQDSDDLQAIRRAFKACADLGIYVPAASTGQRTAFLVLSQRPEFPHAMKGGGRAKTRRFWLQIEQLRQMRHLQESSIQRSNRHKVATLDLTTEGRVQCA